MEIFYCADLLIYLKSRNCLLCFHLQKLEVLNYEKAAK